MRRGEAKNFTGISSPYQPPERPDLTLDTGHCSPEECVELLLTSLESVHRRMVPFSGDRSAGGPDRRTACSERRSPTLFYPLLAGAGGGG